MRMKIFGQFSSSVFLIVLMTSCTAKKEEQTATPKTVSAQSEAQIESQEIKELKRNASWFRYAASLEREIFKVLRPQINFPLTQFEIISFIFDQKIGIKTNLNRIDCKLYDLVQSKNKKMEIFRSCQRNKVLIATVDFLTNEQIEIKFFSKEWATVIGTGVALVSPDRVCMLTVQNEKLLKMSCKNTAVSIGQVAAESEEMRLEEFIFDQKQTQQVHVRGGLYKNLIEHRKLQLDIPFEGRIKIIEKEIKVFDEFIETENKNENKRGQMLQSAPHVTIEDTNGKKEDQKNSEKSDDEKENSEEIDKKENSLESKDNSKASQEINSETAN